MWRHAREKHFSGNKNAFDVGISHIEKQYIQKISTTPVNETVITVVNTVTNNNNASLGEVINLPIPASLNLPYMLRQFHDDDTFVVPLSNYQLISGDQKDILSSRLRNSEFFEYYHKKQSIKYLAAVGLQNNTHFIDHISHEDAIYHVRMAKSYYQMTAKERYDHFQGKSHEAKIQSVNRVSLCKEMNEWNQNSLISCVLYSEKEVNTCYLKSKHSIVKSLPIPHTKIIDRHPYVPPVCAIQYILAFSPKLDFMCKDFFTPESPNVVESMWDSKRGRDLATIAISSPGSTDKIFLFLVLWSDDFENNNCKRNRGSTWTLLLSVSPPNGNNNNDNTVVLSMGHKSWSHMKVYEQLWKDLLHLQNNCTTFYHGGLKQSIEVVALHAVTLRDTPERRKANGIIGHNGSFGLVMDHVFNAKQCTEILPSCDGCYQRRLQKLRSLSNCPICVDWNIKHKKCTVAAKVSGGKNIEKVEKEIDSFRKFKDSAGLYVYKPRNQNGSKLVVPVRKRTFPFLIETVKEGFKRQCCGHWSRGSVKLYLSTAGVPDEIQKEVCDASENLKRELRAQGISNVQEEMVDEQKIPICEAWTVPDTSPLSTNIPVPMHLWFHGITSTSFEVLGQWLTTINKKAPMSRCITEKLMGIKNLSLESFKALEIGVANTDFSTAGYQAENYRCMALTFRWLFSDMSNKVQGLLNDYKIQEQFELASDLVDILPCIVARAMKSTIVLSEDPKDMERHCKLFLSVITRFQNSFQEDNATKSFTSAPNFGAMLGPIYETMKEYPPYRRLWEGGCMGEGYLRSIKQLKYQTSSKTSGWALSLMQRVYYYDAFRRCGIITQSELETEENVCSKPTSMMASVVGRHKKFCSYQHQQFEDTINYHRPISALQLSDKSVIIVRRRGRELKKSVIGATITFNDAEGISKLGGWWCPININVRNYEEESELKDSDLVGFLELLLLPDAPLDAQSRSVETLYHCISNKWKERSDNDVYRLPKFSKAAY
jgi:hypothetical protein